MALVDTHTAIGTLGEVLRSELTTRTSAAAVDVGRPDEANTGNGPKLNLFLYQIDIDGNLRDQALDSGQPPALWLILRYLVTAYDVNLRTDSSGAHGLLGESMLALHEMNTLQPTVAGLDENPQTLKISFDPADSDLLSKLMQAHNEPYRLSAAFQIRPVLIAPVSAPTYAPLVKSIGPPEREGVVVIPGFGSRLQTVMPEYFEADTILTFTGEGLSGDMQEVCFGSQCYPVIGAPAGQLLVALPLDTVLSPGAYAIRAVREITSHRRVSSNAVLGHLLPTLDAVTHGVLTANGADLFGDITLTGVRLGNSADEIYVAVYQDGDVLLMLEASGAAAQDTITVSIGIDDALPPGQYRIILRVNSEQAANSPELDWT